MGAGRRRKRVALLVALLGFVALFAGLGAWQLERRIWKHALIERIDARLGAAPVAPPPPERWPTVGAASDEYRRLRLAGHWLGGASVRVQAVTRLGPGCWLLAPLRLADGTAVLVNRGFLSGETGACAATTSTPALDPRAPVELVGLLRLSEPDGGFLRRNDPAAGRWYSRDVVAIAAALRPGVPVAPYFVDAEAAPAGTARPGDPVGGLTVVAFRDDHLVYASTWFALAALSAFAAWRLLRLPRERE